MWSCILRCSVDEEYEVVIEARIIRNGRRCSELQWSVQVASHTGTDAANILIYDFFDKEQFAKIQKHAGCMFPSACEGFGHSLYEARMGVC